MDIKITTLTEEFYIENSEKIGFLGHGDKCKEVRGKYLLEVSFGACYILLPFRSNINIGRKRDIKKGYNLFVKGKKSVGLSFEKMIFLKKDTKYILLRTSINNVVPQSQAKKIINNIEMIKASLKNYIYAYARLYKKDLPSTKKHFLFKQSTIQYFFDDLMNVLSTKLDEKGSQVSYRSTIIFPKTLEAEKLEKYRKVLNNAHDNRVGTILDSSRDPYVMIFEGAGEFAFQVNSLALSIMHSFEHITEEMKSWLWEDTKNPNENHDIKEAMLAFRKKYGY